MRRLTRLLVVTLALLLSAVLLPGASASLLVHGEPVDGLLPAHLLKGDAVPLAAPVPHWYTPQLDARVRAAGAEGVPLPHGATIPTSAMAFSGIRPGSWMLSPAGCTMNFVFGSPGSYHIGTAGHCTEVGDEVTLLLLPDLLVNIGTTAASVNNSIGDDFALIEVRPELQALVNPSMAITGGPTAAASAPLGTPVLHVGHGLVVGTGGTPRAGVITYAGPGEEPSSDAIGWVGAGSPGDSGSPVRSLNGAAVGNFTHLVVGGPYVPSMLAGTSIARMEQIARMPVATASLLPSL